MSIFKFLAVIVLMVSFILILGADTPKIPNTPAGKMLNRFLGVIESGDIEDFVKKLSRNQHN